MDQSLLDGINQFARATPWLHGTIRGYANYGVVIFGLLLVAGWWTARRRGTRAVALALLAAVSTLLAVAVNQPIVHAVAQARPYTAHPDLLVLATRTSDFSFPSDHAIMAGAVAAGLWLVSRRLGLIAAGAAVLMAFSRVYIAAHYPHDVAAGLLLGAAIATTIGLAAGRSTTQLIDAAARTRLRPLVTATAPTAVEQD